jgi:ABC-type polysaccharide/polyol phosphate export permease
MHGAGRIHNRDEGRRVANVSSAEVSGVVDALPRTEPRAAKGAGAQTATAHLYRVDAAEPAALGTLPEVVRELWHSRELLGQLTRREIRIRYKQAVMGFGWALIMPLLVVCAGLLVRYAMAYVSNSPVEGTAVAGMAVKAIGWSFFVGAIGFATPSLLASIGLVTKVYFPREVLPLSAVAAQSFDTAIGIVAVAVLLPFMGVVPSLAALWAVPVLVTLLVFTAAAGLFLSCANLFFRDVKYIVQVMLTFGIFFTPVLFEPAMFGALGAKLLMLNPIAPLLEGLRLSVVEGHDLLQPLGHAGRDGRAIVVWTPLYLLYSALWAFGGLLASLRLFRSASSKFAEFA